jgi:hypothetical protein
MQEISASLVVTLTQEQNATEEHLTHLKRPRSPSEDLVPYKKQASQEIKPKREFYSREGPGIVKTIWVIRDIQEVINSSASEIPVRN